MNEIDWNPLLCEIAALRRELRVVTFALLAASTQDDRSRDHNIDQAYQNQGAADQIAKGGKA